MIDLYHTLSIASKWQQPIAMELAHSVNPSHWEVNGHLTLGYMHGHAQLVRYVSFVNIL